MSMSPDAIQLADIIYESVLGLAGLWLLWSLALSPTARAKKAMRLGPWKISPADFGLLLWCVFAAGLLATFAAQSIASVLKVGPEAYLVMVGPAVPAGAVLGYAGFHFWTAAGRTAAVPQRGFLLPGLATFLVVLPLVEGVAFLWPFLLQFAGLPVEPQGVVEDYVGMKSPALQASMTFFAVVIAPVAEEWVFRAALFRYLRGRVPRWAALLLPAALFAALHGLTAFGPLLVFALVFELAYERTGNIAVTMFAHALFNLNTVLFLLLDPPK